MRREKHQDGLKETILSMGVLASELTEEQQCGCTFPLPSVIFCTEAPSFPLMSSFYSTFFLFIHLSSLHFFFYTPAPRPLRQRR